MTKHVKRKLNLVQSIKMVVGTLAVSTYFMEHEKIAFWMLIAGAVLDGVVNYYTKDIEIRNEHEIKE